MGGDSDSGKGNQNSLWKPSLTDNGLGNAGGYSQVKLNLLLDFKPITEFGFLGSFCDQGHELSLVKGKEGNK